MVECPSCGQKHLPGTLFCSNCGVYLPTGGPLGTKPITEAESTSPPKPDSVPSPAGAPRRLYLEIAGTGRRIPLPSTGELLIGRLDAARGIFPDVDLAPNGGREAGVSRKHCKIYRQGAGYEVEDLGSANGSLLNGKRLTPHMAYPIEAGDELYLGKLKLRILAQDQIKNGA